MKERPKFKDIEIKDPWTYPRPEEAVANILGNLKALYSEIIDLEKRLDPYLQGTKDNEIINELKAELEELRNKEYFYNNYCFSPGEIKKGIEWCSKHPCRGGVSGGNFAWTIIPTGLGVAKEVRCSCGDSFTIKGLG